MMRFLAPYALPLIGAGCALVAALSVALWLSITSHAETRAERDAAIEYIKATKELRNEIDDLPDSDDDIVDWLLKY